MTPIALPERSESAASENSFTLQSSRSHLCIHQKRIQEVRADAPPLPPLDHQTYPVLKNPLNRSTSSSPHSTLTSNKTFNATPPTPGSSESRPPCSIKGKRAFSLQDIIILNPGLYSTTRTQGVIMTFSSDGPSIMEEDDDVSSGPKMSSDYALRAVFIRFTTLAEAKMNVFLRETLDDEPVLSNFMGPSLDPKVDDLMGSLGKIAQKRGAGDAVRPPEAFEEEAEFLELLAKSFANAHDLRFKIAFADALTRLLRPIGKTAQAEVIHIDTVEGARARSSILPNGLLDCDARENSSELDRLQHHHDQDKKIWRCAFLSFIQASFQQPLKVAVDCRAMIDAAASRHHPSIVHLAGLSTLSRRLPSGTSRAPGSADKERYNQVKDDMNSIDRWYLWIKILCLISAAVLSSNLVENIHELLRTMSTTRCLFSGFSQLLEDLNDVYFLPFHDDVRSKSGSLGSSGCSRRQACLRSAVAHIYFLIAPQLQHHGSPAKQDAISYYVLKFIRNMETSFLVTAENRDDYALQRLCLRTRMRLFTGFSEEWCQGIQSESAKQRYILMQRAAAANDPQAESDSAERLSTRDLTTL
ncbi:hypothetical protein C8R48DRAFT_782820 [Suillus tomentosus]|nr:hypothetical protein C8R48DRAFT_782820 [Suillus tomentosus]